MDPRTVKEIDPRKMEEIDPRKVEEIDPRKVEEIKPPKSWFDQKTLLAWDVNILNNMIVLTIHGYRRTEARYDGGPMNMHLVPAYTTPLAYWYELRDLRSGRVVSMKRLHWDAAHVAPKFSPCGTSLVLYSNTSLHVLHVDAVGNMETVELSKIVTEKRGEILGRTIAIAANSSRMAVHNRICSVGRDRQFSLTSGIWQLDFVNSSRWHGEIQMQYSQDSNLSGGYLYSVGIEDRRGVPYQVRIDSYELRRASISNPISRNVWFGVNVMHLNLKQVLLTNGLIMVGVLVKKSFTTKFLKLFKITSNRSAVAYFAIDPQTAICPSVVPGFSPKYSPNPVVTQSTVYLLSDGRFIDLAAMAVIEWPLEMQMKDQVFSYAECDHIGGGKSSFGFKSFSPIALTESHLVVINKVGQLLRAEIKTARFPA